MGGRRAEQLSFDELMDGLLVKQEVQRLRSIGRTRCAIKALRRFFSDFRALDITSRDTDAYVLDRRAQGVADGTIQRELGTLHRAFRIAVKDKVLPYAPQIDGIRLSNTRQGFVEPGEMEVLLAALPDWLAPPVEFAWFTGWRLQSEILPLRWRQVDFEGGTVRLEPGTTKNADGRTFPFDVWPELEQLLLKQREHTTALEKEKDRIIPLVFHKNGNHLPNHFRDTWHACCRDVGLQGTIPHDLRRSAVRRLEKAGVPRSIAMKLTGHKSESVYKRYAIAAEQDLRDGVKKLAALTGTTWAQSGLENVVAVRKIGR